MELLDVPPPALQRVLGMFYTFVPITAVCYYCIASLASSLKGWAAQKKAPEKPVQQKANRGRKSVGYITFLVWATYIGEAVALITASFSKQKRAPAQDVMTYTLASGLLWLILILGHVDSDAPPSYQFIGCWLIYIVAETIRFALFFVPGSPRPLSVLPIVSQVTRLSFLVLLICAAFRYRVLSRRITECDEESQPLLGENGHVANESENAEAPANGTAYGSLGQANGATSGQSSPEADEEKDAEKDKGLRNALQNMKGLVPFFWPSRNPRLQLHLVAVGLILALERALNIVIPVQIGLITNILSGKHAFIPWKEIMVFVALRLLDSSGGIPTARQYFWAPLEDYAYTNLSTTAFNHVMSLSCDFHANKRTGKLLQAVIRGRTVKYFVNDVLFTIGPMLVDLVLAVSVLYYMFGTYMGLTIAAVVVMFIWWSKKMLQKRTSLRKDYNEHAVKEFSVLSESMSNWPTISYFNRIAYEEDRYSTAVDTQISSRRTIRLWNYLGSNVESTLLILGLTVACLIGAYSVVMGYKPVGSFVMLLSYWAELSGPLRYLAYGLAQIADQMVDVEEYLELLRLKPSVVNRIDAKAMDLEHTDVEFADVDFSYDGKRDVLNNVNFIVKSGQTVAIVGQTGGGKSTILKLITRFYDPTKGSVKIGGYDISAVTLESLRENIGVVPQDPALFHDTLLNNVRYAKLDASDEEVIEACKAVALHERILGFPDGYNTMVGERGVKLSGGELQRVAIARAILKNPKVVLLDEATSSVDSETEAHVQASLKLLTAQRTTIIIAHRLSTVVNADQILVLKDGQIAEQGSHFELLKKEGHYHRLWTLQSSPHTTGASTGILIDDLHDEEVPVGNMSSNGQVSGENVHAVDSNDNSGPKISSKGDGIDTQQSRSGKDSVGAENESAHGTSPTKPSGLKKTWKPDAPEFIPRSLNKQISPTPGHIPTRDDNGHSQTSTAHVPSRSVSAGSSADGDDNMEIITEYALGKENIGVRMDGSSSEDQTLLDTENEFDQGKVLTTRPQNVVEAAVKSNIVENDDGPKSGRKYAAEQPSSEEQGFDTDRRNMSASEPAGVGLPVKEGTEEEQPLLPHASESPRREGRPMRFPGAGRRRRGRQIHWRNQSRKRVNTQSGTDAG